MDAELLISLLNTVDRIEKKLDALGAHQGQSEWLNKDDFCKLVGINSHGLRHALQKGKIYGDAIRNTGTAKRAYLRFHRTKAVDQYLKKLPTNAAS